MEVSDSITLQENIDRIYHNTAAPNELYFTSGDSTHIALIVNEGFNNIHLIYTKNPTTTKHLREFIGYSPCQVIPPVELDTKKDWRGILTLRWFPLPMPPK